MIISASIIAILLIYCIRREFIAIRELKNKLKKYD